MPHKYLLTIEYDQSTESPNDYDSFVVRSFSNRHVDNVDYNRYLESECPECDGHGGTHEPNKVPLDYEYTECPDCEGTGVVDCTIDEHPDVLAVLSYYEHGECQWMVGPSTVPDYGGFDTAQVAGVITFSDDADESTREWFNAMDNNEKKEILDSVAKVYTSWANGECFYYRLEEIKHCETCGQGTNAEMDSCGGFIGSDGFSDYINHEVLHGIDPADVELAGEAEYSVSLQPVQVNA